jgi:serine/threonine protein kinase/tetratricopeptide (TPR) repeat protein
MPIDGGRVKSLFLAASDLPAPAERAAYLDRECGGDVELRARVEALLRVHDAAPPPPDAAPRTAANLPEGEAETEDYGDPTARIGAVLGGKYKLIEAVGEGGMGSVYMAQQTEPVKRAVAVKVIKAGMDSKAVLARFEAERQALAMMDHPNIAKVLDAGTTDGGRPFFVMELVKGAPITCYCDEHKLTPRQRLELFVPVCQAIQHAHQKGITHRDIKPSNVLVAMYDDRAVPKVIDFGVAKAAGPSLTDQTLMTGFGALVGTPEYMSPEQASLNNLDVDTRSDVYSLGVLLYELLTGSTPVDRKSLGKAALLEILRIVREVEVPRPSAKLSTMDTLPSVAANRGTEPARLSRLMKGELDWLVMKALEKDRTRRYETANGLARDIQRYLADEPVEARPPSASYLLRKFVTRNKVQVLAAIAVLLALIGGVIGTTYGLLRASSANAGLAQANDQLKQANGKIEMRYNLALDAIKTFHTGVSEDFLLKQNKFKELRDRLLKSASDFYGKLRNLLDRENDFAARRELLQANFEVANLTDMVGRKEDALAAHLAVLAAREDLAKEPEADPETTLHVARSLTAVASLQRQVGKTDQAMGTYRKALGLLDNLTDSPMAAARALLADCHTGLGLVLRDSEPYAIATKAHAEHGQALTISQKLVDDHPDVADYLRRLAESHYNLATTSNLVQNKGEAEAEYRAAMALYGKLAHDHPALPNFRMKLADCKSGLGWRLLARGSAAEAEAELREGVKICRRLADDYPGVTDFRKNLADCHNDLWRLMLHLKRPVEQEAELREALTIQEKLVEEQPTVLDFRTGVVLLRRNLATTLSRAGKSAAAEAEYRLIIDLYQKLANDYPRVTEYRAAAVGSRLDLGILLAQAGKPAAAEAEYRQVIADFQKLAADFPAVATHRLSLANGHHFLGDMQRGLGKLLEAEEQYRKEFAVQQTLATDFPDVADYQVRLGGSYCNFGQFMRASGKPAADSLAWFQNAIDALRPTHEKDPSNAMAKQFLRNSYWNRALAHDELGRFAEALRDWDRAVELSPMSEQPALRAARALSKVRAGQVAEAVAEVADLTEVSKSASSNAGALYDLACMYAVASGKVANKKPEYLDQSMALLQSAVKAGFNNAAHIKQDKDLGALRDRVDFKKLLAELEK